MNLKAINKDLAQYFIKTYHYSKYYLGMYSDENELLGVITLGWGTQPLQTIKKIFYKDDLKTKDYLEIGKMCFLPKVNNTKSFGTQAMSLLVKWVKQNTDCLFLYTMADGIMGKCGYVYQASSMIYLGSFETQVYMDKESKEKIHPRSARQLLIENAIELGIDKICWLTHDFCEKHGIDKIIGLMFRYIMPLNKKSKKILDNYDEYKQNPYPKDKDLIFKKRIGNNIYIYIDQPKFNMNAFNYNHQKNHHGSVQLDLFDFMEKNSQNKT